MESLYEPEEKICPGDGETERWRDGETEEQKDRETEGQRDRETEGQKDRAPLFLFVSLSLGGGNGSELRQRLR
jgi:hypothetical protein